MANETMDKITDGEIFGDDDLYLGNRSLDEDKHPVIYHYCSADTLTKILANKTLRFSDLSLLNDAEEQVWGSEKVFSKVLSSIRSGRGVPADFPPVSDSYIDAIEKEWTGVQSTGQPFVCCLSSDGDSLSQWRAYAQDGTGFALGFRSSSLGAIPAQALEVCYDVDQQISEMFESIGNLIKNKTEADFRSDEEYRFLTFLSLTGRAIAFKNPAFRDEKEVRLSHGVWVEKKGEEVRLETLGGYVNGKSVSTPDIKFEARSRTVVPFFDIPLGQNGLEVEISHLTIGPRCRTTIQDARRMLGTLGVSGVQISVAGALYR